MAELKTTAANLRITDEDKRSVLNASNILPTVSADTLAGFVDGVETLYNNGVCAAKVNIALNLIR